MNEITTVGQNDAFWKGLKVIQSCKTLDHLTVARKYVNRFIETFCYKKRGYLRASESLSNQIEVLQVALIEQQKKLN